MIRKGKRRFIKTVLLGSAVLCMLASASHVTAQTEKADGGTIASNFTVIAGAGYDAEPGCPVFLPLDENLLVETGQGAKIPISEYELNGAVPVYQISSEEAADRLIQYLSLLDYADGIVCSDHPQYVAKVRGSVSTLRGMIDYRRGVTLTKREYIAEIRHEVNANSANAALFRIDDLDRNSVSVLQSLLITVFAEAGNREQTLCAAAAGVNGILAGEATNLSELFSGLTGDVFVKRALLISHRGSTDVRRENGYPYYENTVESARAAVTRAGADMIEIDIHLTADDKVVVMHDDTVDRTTTGSGPVQDLTYEELKRYRVDGNSDQKEPDENRPLDAIPLLSDYFEQLSDLDFYYLIEIKGNRPEVVGRALSLVDEYGMEDRVSFISFMGSMLSEVRRQNPGISVGLLHNSISANEAGQTAEIFARRVMEATGALNATFNPNYGKLNRAGAQALLDRGLTVWPWTYQQLEAFSSDYYKGYQGMTTDHPDYLAGMVKSFTLSTDRIGVGEDGAGAITAEAVLYSGEKKTVRAELLPLSGSLMKGENGYYSKTPGRIRAVAAVRTDELTQNLILSDVVTLEAGSESSGKSGCGGCSGGGGQAAVPLLLSAILAAWLKG